MSKVDKESNGYITEHEAIDRVRPDAPSIGLWSQGGGWVLERAWRDDRLEYTGYWVYIGDPTKRSVSNHSTP